jgi:hypothetical protein
LLLNEFIEVFETLTSKEIENGTLFALARQIYDDVLLVGSNQFVFKPAECGHQFV